jgi:hypothetical protein
MFSSSAPASSEDFEVFAVAAATSRFWRPGDPVVAGEIIGTTVSRGEPVRAVAPGRIASIQYDIDRDELILLVAPEQ